MQWAIYCWDKLGMEAAPRTLVAEQNSFVTKFGERVIGYCHFVSDDGRDTLGTSFFMELDDLIEQCLAPTFNRRLLDHACGCVTIGIWLALCVAGQTRVLTMSPHYGKFIAYFRGSTDRQGKSGLGLDAQREAVMNYLNGGRWTLVDEFTEVESGKRNDRPELEKALAACKRQKAKLVIAKLDRLSRNLAFIAALMESGRRVRGRR